MTGHMMSYMTNEMLRRHARDQSLLSLCRESGLTVVHPFYDSRPENPITEKRHDHEEDSPNRQSKKNEKTQCKKCISLPKEFMLVLDFGSGSSTQFINLAFRVSH